MACSEISFFVSSPRTPMWFIPNARSLSPGTVICRQASYRLCFSASWRSIGARASLGRCGNVCGCLRGKHSNVVGSVCRRGAEVRPVKWSTPETVRLMNDSHSASAKGNFCKGIFDSIVPSGIAIFYRQIRAWCPYFSAGAGVPASLQYEQNVLLE